MVAVVTATLSDAYATCVRDARRHYENFPVASLLVPRAQRPHIAAVYAFARAADDFADEGNRSVQERYRLLERWLRRLHDAANGDAPRPLKPGEPTHTHQIFAALAATIRDRALPVMLLEDLLSAFRQDVTVTRYETWTDLFDYCRRSANPVGRLVLRIGGYDDPLRLVGRRARLLPAIGEPGWQASAPDRGLSRCRARPVVGRVVHGAPADQFLAGCQT